MTARFCVACGGALVAGIPPGEDRERLCCEACGRVHYQNPQVDAACVFEAADGSLSLAVAALGSGERIQEAALRALGGDAARGLAEERVTLCCALTDTRDGRVCLVFRVEGRVGIPPATPAPTGWHAALLERLGADAGRLPPAVYTAAWDGIELQMAEVPRD